jgi:hypothetical protein
LLQDIRALQVSPSSLGELRRVAARDGLRLDVPANCGAEICGYYLFPDKQWMHSLLSQAFLVKVGPHVGLRRWFVVGGVFVKETQPVGKWFGVQMFEDKPNSFIEVVSSEEPDLLTKDCWYYPLKRHPGYEFRTPANIHQFEIFVSPSASVQNRDHAFQFDLHCLTSWQQCDQFSDFVPAAWVDFEDDKPWVEANRERLEKDNQSDPRCKLPKLRFEEHPDTSSPR